MLEGDGWTEDGPVVDPQLGRPMLDIRPSMDGPYPPLDPNRWEV